MAGRGQAVGESLGLSSQLQQPPQFLHEHQGLLIKSLKHSVGVCRRTLHDAALGTTACTSRCAEGDSVKSFHKNE